MISRRAMVNLVTFFALAVALIAYGAFDLLRGNLPVVNHPREISAFFDDASGLRTDFSASFNGVVVGVVRHIRLEGNRVKVTVALDHGVQIPGDVEARVIRASPVGEQRIDFVPTKGGTAPPLRSGAVVPTAPDADPPVVSDVLDVTVRLLEAIPADQLNTLIHETATALRGRSDDIRTIIDASDVFSQEFLAHEQGFRQLLASSPPVLDAVASVGPQLRQALANTTVLTEVLARRRADLVTLLREGARLGTVGNDLVASQKANLACLVSDVADLSRFAGSPAPLGNLDTGLHINQQFFGPIDKIAPSGPALNVGLGAPTRDDQVWLRVRTLVPPGQPAAVSYNPKRPTPPTKPGGACTNEFGQGVGPATQANPEPPAKGGSVQAPSGPDNRVTPSRARPIVAVRPAGSGRDPAPSVLLVAAGLVVLALAGKRPPVAALTREVRADEGSPSRLRRPRREAVLGVLALLGLTGTLAFGLAWNHARTHNSGLNQARATARNFLTALTNFDGKTIDADFNRIRSYATGAFASQADQFYADKDTRNALRVRQASSRGEIKDLFVQSSVRGRVRVYGVIDQTIANNALPTPQADELRIELGLTRVKGVWRVYDVRVLQAPASNLPGSPTTPTTPFRRSAPGEGRAAPARLLRRRNTCPAS